MGAQLYIICKDNWDLMTKNPLLSNFQAPTAKELNVQERKNKTRDAVRATHKRHKAMSFPFSWAPRNLLCQATSSSDPGLNLKQAQIVCQVLDNKKVPKNSQFSN